MPMKYTQAQKAYVEEKLLKGSTVKEISEDTGITERTIRTWYKAKHIKGLQENRQQTIINLEKRIKELSGKKGGDSAKDLAMLTNSLKRIQTTTIKARPVPVVQKSINEDILKRVLAPEYGLYKYQSDYIKSDSRFNIVNKSRQIGFTWVVALKALIKAVSGRKQNVLSASERQANIVKKYILDHAKRLNIDVKKQENGLSVGGVDINILPCNIITIQGLVGDIILDEFAWARRQKELFNAIVPAITTCNGTIDIISTPSVAGNFFYEIMTNQRGKYDSYERHTITILDAIDQGLPISDKELVELKSLFDSSSWDMLYMCAWAMDGDALLSWDLLQSAATLEAENTLYTKNICFLGVDVGRKNDLSAFALVEQLKVDKFALKFIKTYKNIRFEKQEEKIQELMHKYNVYSANIDKTGIGMQLAESLENNYDNVQGRHFTLKFKQRLAKNLLFMLERGMLALPSDSFLLSKLHSVKKKATPSGKDITYDADRDSQGHGDEFWALALAVDNLASEGALCEAEILG